MGGQGECWIENLRCRLAGFAPLPMRLAVGATMAVHGWGKVSGDASLGEVAARLIVPLGLPESMVFMGYIAIASEFLGGIGLLLGLCTRVSALAVAGTMAGAIYAHSVTFGQGFKAGAMVAANGTAQGTGWEWQALLFATSLSLAVYGGGCLSLDALVCKLRNKGCGASGGCSAGGCAT